MITKNKIVANVSFKFIEELVCVFIFWVGNELFFIKLLSM